MFSNSDIFVVTGATSGIGKGVVKSLLEEGSTVIAVGRCTNKLNKLKQEVNESGKLFLELKDLSLCDGLDKWTVKLSKKYGKLNGLVLSAGVQQITPISSPFSVEKSKELFEINYFSSINITKGFCDRRANIGKGSSVVILSSIASKRGNAGIVGYASSKGAINAAVKSLTIEYAPSGVRINTVLPGFVMTEMIETWKEVYTEEKLKELNNSYPLGLGKVDDIVGPIMFLLSKKSNWITGCEFIVDGGGSL
jgi:NAD(P)-dependent dehydrogenase (short-subunit alcohol dehydrogenase family)